MRDPDTAFLLVTALPWAYMDETRCGARAEPVLSLGQQSGEWSSAAGFTREDIGAEISVDAENPDTVTVTRWGSRGERLEEHAFTARWQTPPPVTEGTGWTISRVDPRVGGPVRIEEKEVVLTNPAVKIRRVFLWPSSGARARLEH